MEVSLPFLTFACLKRFEIVYSFHKRVIFQRGVVESVGMPLYGSTRSRHGVFYIMLNTPFS